MTLYTYLSTEKGLGVAFVPKVLPEVCLVQHCVGQLIQLLRDVRGLRGDTEPWGQNAHFEVR